MAAVIKLTTEQVREICGRYSDVYPVNFNCREQITQYQAFPHKCWFFEVKAVGGRAIPLKVKGTFHSPLIQNMHLTHGTL